MLKMSNFITFVIVILVPNWFNVCNCLDNGLALTPPMGFMTWQRFRCNTDCVNYPNECISENLIKRTADHMAADGYLDAGYEYVIVDDCWLAMERNSNGELQPDPYRFPSGIRHLADYVHGKGLKFGIYQDYGTKTCAGYPGLMGHLKQDAFLFAQWGVDYIKIDGCNSPLSKQEAGYVEFGRYLNQTGRPIVYSCSWPAYWDVHKVNYKLAMTTCNLWRNTFDIDDSLASVRAIEDWGIKYQHLLTQYGGPGHWNDPDMLIIGNFGLSLAQSQAQMAVWAILAAPLLMSVDLATIRPEFKHILQNREVIAINQDRLGLQGAMVYTDQNIYFWVKPIQSNVSEQYSFAIACISRRSDGEPFPISVSLLKLFVTSGVVEYAVTDLYNASIKLNHLKSNDNLHVRVVPSGVVFLRLTAERTLSNIVGDVWDGIESTLKQTQEEASATINKIWHKMYFI